MKNHIFHIISKFDLGGAERVALNIAKSPDYYQYHLIEILHSKSKYNEEFEKEAKNNGIILHRAHTKNSIIGVLLTPFRLLYLYLRYHPIVIHVHTEIPSMGVFLFYKFFKFIHIKSKLYQTIHSTNLWNGRWSRIGYIVEETYKKAKNVAISEGVFQSYAKRYGLWDIPIVNNGVSIVKQYKYIGIKSSCLNILYAGRLSKEKGTELLIEILNYFKNDRRFYFHIIGSGEESISIKNVVENSDNISLKEKVYNLPQYLGSFDYVIIPSVFEGLGLISIESSFAKTPCIINDIPGLKETLPNDWPLKVKGNSIDIFIQIIDRLPQRNDYEELSDTAYMYVRNRFSLKKMQEQYEALYKTCENEI